MVCHYNLLCIARNSFLRCCEHSHTVHEPVGKEKKVRKFVSVCQRFHSIIMTGIVILRFYFIILICKLHFICFFFSLILFKTNIEIWIDSMLLCVCSVIDHRCQNEVRTKTQGNSCKCHWCSYHILTSSVINYWTGALQHGIYNVFVLPV